MELLAPVGNLTKLKYALRYGADAVYLGVPEFSLRTRINEIDETNLAEAVMICRAAGKKIYVTANILAHERHFDALRRHLALLSELSVDALIASDPGVIALARELAPNIAIHLSTQANCTNILSARAWQEQGVKRIIAARELSIAELALMKSAVPDLELECFVHGAMCMSYSGRCFLSKHFLGRSGNLGDCVQPCRWKYYITEEKRPGQPLELDEDAHGSYLFNSKDLCLIDYLPELKAAGLDSLKIEGRAKSLYYLANVVGAYRRAIDLLDELSPQEWRAATAHLQSELLEKTVSRGFTKGFAFGDQTDEDRESSRHDSAWEFCAETVAVEELDGRWRHTIKIHNAIFSSQMVEVISPPYEVKSFLMSSMLLENGEEVTEAHGGQEKLFYVELDYPLQVGSLWRRKL